MADAGVPKLLEAASLYRYLFYDARKPLYLAGEFPPEYHEKENRSAADEAKAWSFVYANRWKSMAPQMLELAKLRASAEAVLSQEVAKAIEALARKGRELQNFMRERVEQYRVGPNIVSQWPDQAVGRACAAERRGGSRPGCSRRPLLQRVRGKVFAARCEVSGRYSWMKGCPFGGIR